MLVCFVPDNAARELPLADSDSSLWSFRLPIPFKLHRSKTHLTNLNRRLGGI